jgi:hypothetical protein
MRVKIGYQTLAFVSLVHCQVKVTMPHFHFKICIFIHIFGTTFNVRSAQNCALEGMVTGSKVHGIVHSGIETLLAEPRAHSPRGSTHAAINNYFQKIVKLNVHTFFFFLSA